MQQVDLIDDHQTHQLRVRALPRLARDDVPLLRRGDDHLRLLDLLPGEVLVSGELLHHHTEGRQLLAEGEHALLHQRLHGSHVHDLEAIQVEGAILPAALRQLVQHAHQSNVRLTRTRGRAQQQVLRVIQRRRHHLALYPVERPDAPEGWLHPLGQVQHIHQLLSCGNDWSERRHVHLLVALLLRAPRLVRQLAPLVGHQVPPLSESQVIQVEELVRHH
mmetsp:Transcript_19004/g.42319  ORF Transcript_19004/g.42319 Transcript_19004/m.42319 type:complete len:219 (-) Transcript_19004:582-1238(-)